MLLTSCRDYEFDSPIVVCLLCFFSFFFLVLPFHFLLFCSQSSRLSTCPDSLLSSSAPHWLTQTLTQPQPPISRTLSLSHSLPSAQLPMSPLVPPPPLLLSCHPKSQVLILGNSQKFPVFVFNFVIL